MAEKFVNINDRSEFVDALADLLTSCHAKHKSGCFAPDCRECIDRFFGISNGHLLPAADVAPVRHVTNRAKYFGETLCPNCGIHLDETTIISKDENEDGDIIHYEFQPNFCANCGARMDGDSNAGKT